MNIKDNHLTLTSKVIIEAVSGDPIAMNCVLNHYQVIYSKSLVTQRLYRIC